jgi:hypothetical protein
MRCVEEINDQIKHDLDSTKPHSVHGDTHRAVDLGGRKGSRRQRAFADASRLLPDDTDCIRCDPPILAAGGMFQRALLQMQSLSPRTKWPRNAAGRAFFRLKRWRRQGRSIGE